ncbi:peptidylprolyl isomerase [Anabaena cylindrica FACHB-243]|uniref:peptidylprolyl isomerase n=1 Tax=Anabaena cylindrica (strain ATCC 27899 / PCC 7122) TaxID=272123 RepID=K9ZMD6_ANACC|nr:MULTISPECIES: peptidylprolyl isomerase [Anabaena]AFZ59959.1 PpiC-type peptidyl-prolyl cis-trans isomerase [Anabaena cylindrica PCC 7122]MBD2417982.1 peptidylprolyl isomerase [Anabaena cylindrica FACHB-243]MBY5282666.1 peptidylprolyl isomerase [Anabaena sp. CCAP 1446/1C]MBY5307542.1 peptidylprolyl isomerase [Anabaena sp. CCAP 1446/1C]MCM2404899.1 peptidylprolyl isomerase [Anabaena sp. CCAP 1446/1C]
MESSSFLTVNDEQIDLSQVVKYLQVSGKLNQFISDVLRQYIIETELEKRDDIDISTGIIEQTIIDYRLKNQLTDPQIFQEWLKNNGTDYATFLASVTFSFKLEKLKALVAESKLSEYFIERKIYLDRVVLSRIMVDNRELAEELHTQIEEGSSFEQLAKEYSLADERVFNGMMGPLSRGSLPDMLRAAVDAVNPSQLIGPIELEGRFSLFRLENILPASLENVQLKQSLQNELFEQWIGEKIQSLTVKLQVS